VSPSTSHPLRSEAEQIVLLTKELEWSRLKIQALEERLRLERIRKYGPNSEKLSDNQLNLLDLEPGVSSEEVEAESRRDPLPASVPSTTAKSKNRKHPGRHELPSHLPRVERVIACTPEQCVCKGCGKDKAVIGS
jgi:transposase